MYEISVSDHFSSAHHLENYHGKCEEPHGHNWQVDVFVKGEILDGSGILIDFKVLKSEVKKAMDGLDHVDLNTLAEFREKNPTSENIAEYLFRELSASLNCDRYTVARISVHETPGSIATYWV